MDLQRANGAAGGAFLFGGPASATLQSLWSPPRVSLIAVPQGTAVLGDWSQVRLVVRSDGELTADRSGDMFRRNLVQLRYEGRFGVAVLRPQAFCAVSLTD